MNLISLLISDLRTHTKTALGALLFVWAGSTSVVMQAAEPAVDPEFEIERYQIQPEDVLDVFVWKEKDLTKKVTVQPDGGISLPLIGNIKAGGRTTSEVQKSITAALQEYIPDAVVTVSIRELKGMRIYVSGKVAAPGQFEIGRYIDVLQALALAGGPNAFADANNITIQRRIGTKVEVYKFNYGQVHKGKKLEQNILLKPNDIVMVP